MRILLYYIFHTFINSIKKLFKTWVAVFLVVVLCFGLLGGIVGATIGSFVEEDEVITEEIEDDEIDAEPLTEKDKAEMIIFIKGCIILITAAVILFSIYGGDKSGTKIFTMPDVNFLFASPLPPQSVLMFRTVLQMGVAIVSSLYLLFQIPNLVLNVGLNIWTCLAIFLGYAFLLYFSRIVSVFTYTFASTHIKVKKYIRPFVIIVIALIFGIYAYNLYYLKSGYLYSFLNMFPTWCEYIPIIGWMAGLIISVAEAEYFKFAIYFVLMVAASIVLTVLVWKVKADFYEDAFSNAQELQETVEAASKGETAKRKKDRSDKIMRNGEFKSCGAKIFFEKTLYNCRRFRKFGTLSSTAYTYLLIAFALCFGGKMLFSFESVIPMGFAMLVCVFFRNLGNPLAEEMNKIWLFTVPEPTSNKLWYSLFGGLLETAIDLIPAFIVTTVILPEKILYLTVWFILGISLDFFCSSVGLFVELALPDSLATSIKAMFAISIRMFSIVPGLITSIIGAATNNVFFLFITVALNIIPAVILMFISPLFLENGKK